MQVLERRLLLDPGIDRLDPLAGGEGIDPLEAQREARGADAGQGRVDVMGVAAVDLPQEPQRDMEIFRRHPPHRARQPAG